MSQKKPKINQQPTKTIDAVSSPAEPGSTGLVGIKLRVSADEHAKLLALAKADGRSLNNYIVHHIIRPGVLHPVNSENHEAEEKRRV